MNIKEILKEHVKKDNREQVFDIIDNKMTEGDVKFAISYIDNLDTISKHEVTKIEYADNGNFCIQCSTGINYIK
ncbi:hypothetical protein CJ739_2332 [Mariniflexile rhizosphaerae]|uniref:hypothetical protein n=1 Tax=unclassified Mariniflexile TaxID=2643887 RepID=UPI000CC7E336|nr:hypothetical protein [Mariniflexile sp. TRM1-10]AXP81406.1 hypothetical protein CJ739_2332 [Mariniflexile sp. TRM1-10]PLB18494.1 MAG: hypothetical protein TRG1_2647 [Flavobacteriaceae bacterium FS1-H7996/R]